MIAAALARRNADWTIAEEVVAEAGGRALRAIGGFADGEALTWVLGIVRRAAFDWLRRHRPEALGSIETLGGLRGAGSDPAEARLPEAASIAGRDAHALEAAIASLPAPLREFLVLRDRFGLSYRQIAAVTGAPVDVAMSGLARARHALIAASAAVGTGARHDAAPRLA